MLLSFHMLIPLMIIVDPIHCGVSPAIIPLEFCFGTQVWMKFVFGSYSPTMSYIPQSMMNREVTCSLLSNACLTDLFCRAHRQDQLFFLSTAKISQQLGRRKKKDYELWKITGKIKWQYNEKKKK